MEKKTSPETEQAVRLQAAQVSRRDLLYVIGAAPALAAGAQTAGVADKKDERSDSGQKTRSGHKVFNDEQWRTVAVLCDLIIPADERSGSATQAGVPEFIDDWIDFQKQENGSDNEEAQILGGLTWLDRESEARFEKRFADASPDQQKQILDRIAWPAKAAPEDRVWVFFFNRFRDLAVSGFFSSKMGVADLPYLGNTAVMKWEGCPPKVWAIVEDRMKNGFNDITREARAQASS